LLLAHTSSGFKHSLQEVLNSKSVQDKIKDMSVFSESVTLDKFFEMLSVDPDRVCYGKRSVEFAMQSAAVDTLLISDKLFRAKSVLVRKAYVSLVEEADKAGVQSMIFSSMNPSGERLDNLSGLAAILRYPLPGIDDIEEEDVDVDQLINAEEEEKEEEVKGDAKKKLTWDEQQLEILLAQADDSLSLQEED